MVDIVPSFEKFGVFVGVSHVILSAIWFITQFSALASKKIEFFSLFEKLMTFEGLYAICQACSQRVREITSLSYGQFLHFLHPSLSFPYLCLLTKDIESIVSSFH